MNVHLCDFDGKMPNLALMRISSYHKARGDSVALMRGRQSPRLFDKPDRVYLSCIFRWNRGDALASRAQLDGACLSGGTGIDIHLTLPDEIAACAPNYSLYPRCDYALGFISRGCIRHCLWCIVPRKEGVLRRVSTAREIVGDRTQVVFLDNNFLALPDCGTDLEWLADSGTAVDFNQGLDARLVTPEIARLLANCRWSKGMRFALDAEQNIRQVGDAFEMLKIAGVNLARVSVYCLIGYAGLASDIERLLFLRQYGVSIFPMGYRDNDTGAEPARGWDKKLYKKYRRLIMRVPHSASVWHSFQREVVERGMAE